MKSRTTERFRSLLAAAPAGIRDKAHIAYRMWLNNPQHPSLKFKKLYSSEPIYSVRIDRDWRAVGVLRGDDMIWFWVGPHDSYEELLKQINEPTKPAWIVSPSP